MDGQRGAEDAPDVGAHHKGSQGLAHHLVQLALQGSFALTLTLALLPPRSPAAAAAAAAGAVQRGRPGAGGLGAAPPDARLDGGQLRGHAPPEAAGPAGSCCFVAGVAAGGGAGGCTGLSLLLHRTQPVWLHLVARLWGRGQLGGGVLARDLVLGAPCQPCQHAAGAGAGGARLGLLAAALLAALLPPAQHALEAAGQLLTKARFVAGNVPLRRLLLLPDRAVPDAEGPEPGAGGREEALAAGRALLLVRPHLCPIHEGQRQHPQVQRLQQRQQLHRLRPRRQAAPAGICHPSEHLQPDCDHVQGMRRLCLRGNGSPQDLPGRQGGCFSR